MQALNELIHIYVDTNQLECKHNYTINDNLGCNAFFIVTTIQGLFQTIPLASCSIFGIHVYLYAISTETHWFLMFKKKK